MPSTRSDGCRPPIPTHVVHLGAPSVGRAGDTSARDAGVSWPLPDDLDDAALEAALFPPAPPSRVRRPEPDWGDVHRELQRHKGVTLQLLWLEYRGAHPDGYQYSRFCDRYREWRGRLDVVLRQVYRAGEKAFVDYAGPTVEVTDRRTGEIHEAKVFVGVLAASNHTFADVTLTRSLPDWTASHVRMFEQLKGVGYEARPPNAVCRSAGRILLVRGQIALADGDIRAIIAKSSHDNIALYVDQFDDCIKKRIEDGQGLRHPRDRRRRKRLVPPCVIRNVQVHPKVAVLVVMESSHRGRRPRHLWRRWRFVQWREPRNIARAN